MTERLAMRPEGGAARRLEMWSLEDVRRLEQAHSFERKTYSATLLWSGMMVYKPEVASQ